MIVKDFFTNNNDYELVAVTAGNKIPKNAELLAIAPKQSSLMETVLYFAVKIKEEE